MTYLLLPEMIRFFENWVAVEANGAGHVVELLASMRPLNLWQEIRPSSLPVVQQWLDKACQQPTAPQCGPLVAALRQGVEPLHWLSLEPDYVGEQAAAGFAYTQLIGPPIDLQNVSKFASDKIAAGFILQAPGIFYSPHYHKAIEFYGVLAGTARWQLGSQPPTWQPSGSCIFHDSDVPHAMETADEPLLAIWAWLGEVDSPLIR